VVAFELDLQQQFRYSNQEYVKGLKALYLVPQRQA